MLFSRFFSRPEDAVLPVCTEKLTTPSLSPDTTPQPRRPRLRSALIYAALFSLLSLTSYICFVAPPVLLSSPLRPQRPVWRVPTRLLVPQSVKRPSVRFEFTPQQELAAITSFITPIASNIIPSAIDPSSPIDPQLILDFDVTRNPEELTNMAEDVWTRHPVVLFAKRYSALSRSIKSKLSSLEMQPGPTFIDVDIRDDKSVLMPILARITGATELPMLLIGGKILRGDDPSKGLDHLLDALQASGELDSLLFEAGVVVGGGRRASQKKKPVQADPKKPKLKKELTLEERTFRGLITL